MDRSSAFPNPHVDDTKKKEGDVDSTAISSQSTTSTLVWFTTSTSKPKERMYTDVSKDCSPTFSSSNIATPSILILSLNSTPKESIRSDSNTDSNVTKTLPSRTYTHISLTTSTFFGDSKKDSSCCITYYR